MIVGRTRQTPALFARLFPPGAYCQVVQNDPGPAPRAHPPQAPAHSTPPARLIRIDADAALDCPLGAPRLIAPASLLVDLSGQPHPACPPDVLMGRATCVGVGTPDEVAGLTTRAVDRVIPRPGCVILPGLVNAHTHLDLTHVGAVEFDPGAGFLAFVRTVLAQRHERDADIAASVALGASLSLRGGVVAVGDIGGVAAGQATLAPWRALRASPLMGVSFLEFFAIGTREGANLSQLREVIDSWTREHGAGDPAPLRLGLQPHAPYTASPDAFACAVATAERLGLPLATHLAENPEERAFVSQCEGPFRDLLGRLNLWDDRVAAWAGQGVHPVAHLAHVLTRARWLLAHVNDADDAAMDVLARAHASVAYCPRSSAYFRNHEHFGPHRYRDMLRRGINVALGTDSVINLPPWCTRGPDARISTLDEARFLRQRDDAPPQLLLDMLTRRGALALGLNDRAFAWTPGAPLAGVVTVPITARSGSPWDVPFQDESRPELVVLGAHDQTIPGP
jgi:cytosine/adenosine deaminase-related metal-dependent hydrolase